MRSDLVNYMRPLPPEIVEPAVPSDREAVIELANFVFKDKTAWINDAFDRKDRSIFLAKKHGELLGFVITRADGPRLVIDLIGVRKFRKGIGRQLIQAVEIAAPVKFREIIAGTYPSNVRAQRFYEALGFRRC